MSAVQLSNANKVATSLPTHQTSQDDPQESMTQKTDKTSTSIIGRSGVSASAARLLAGPSFGSANRIAAASFTLLQATKSDNSSISKLSAVEKSDLQAPVLLGGIKTQRASSPLDALKNKESSSSDLQTAMRTPLVMAVTALHGGLQRVEENQEEYFGHLPVEEQVMCAAAFPNTALKIHEDLIRLPEKSKFAMEQVVIREALHLGKIIDGCVERNGRLKALGTRKDSPDLTLPSLRVMDRMSLRESAIDLTLFLRSVATSIGNEFSSLPPKDRDVCRSTFTRIDQEVEQRIDRLCESQKGCTPFDVTREVIQGGLEMDLALKECWDKFLQIQTPAQQPSGLKEKMNRVIQWFKDHQANFEALETMVP